MNLKGKEYIITDAFSQISPLEPESSDKDDIYVLYAYNIMIEIPATESWLKKIRLAMQADPILSQLKHQIFQGWSDVRRNIPHISGTAGMSYW